MAAFFSSLALLLLVFLFPSLPPPLLGGISSSNIVNGQSGDLKDIHMRIEEEFNLKHPPQYNVSPMLPHLHSKRCVLMQPNQAVAGYVQGKFASQTRDAHVLVGSPCLGSDSLGNIITHYFETITCARWAGLHYMAVGKVWEPKAKDEPSPFIDRLPSIIEHNNATQSFQHASQVLKQQCTCAGSCHERANAAWVKNLDNIKPLLLDALHHHVAVSQAKQTVVSPNDLCTSPQGTVLPLVPAAAIHYRCGDNFVGSYGFLPFEAFRQKIPTDVQTIYVLAENRNRKTQYKAHLALKCDLILSSLFSYLKLHFPSAVVLIRRGDDLYLDMARLAFAKTTVCSVSTFCLWPAIINNGSAYFPRTKLIVSGDVTIKLGFTWLLSPPIVKGIDFESQSSTNALIKILAGDAASTLAKLPVAASSVPITKMPFDGENALEQNEERKKAKRERMKREEQRNGVRGGRMIG